MGMFVNIVGDVLWINEKDFPEEIFQIELDDRLEREVYI